MVNDIYWVCVFRVEPSKFPEFKAVVRPLIEETRKEPGNLVYEYCVTKDRSAIHIIERYKDSAAVTWHVKNTFSKYAKAFTALATVESFIVYGDPIGEAKPILDGFGAVYVDRFDGFTK
jgi:quinol monooxygenase YgiN